MIIYEDVISGDEVLADTYKINEVEGVLWETDCRKYMKDPNVSFELEGANPSAEDGDDDAGGEGEKIMVHDIEDQFRLVWLKTEEGLKPSKKDFQTHIKGYVKKVLKHLEEKGDADAVAEFKKGAPAAVKKLVSNYDNYDVLMGQSMNGEAMYILIDFRDDGVTPYATLWKHGLKEIKV